MQNMVKTKAINTYEHLPTYVTLA